MKPTENGIRFSHDLCSDLNFGEHREWLLTNGRGSYGSGTVCNLFIRGYHGLLVAALTAPVGRTLMLAKLDETITYRGVQYDLSTNGGEEAVSLLPGMFILKASFWKGPCPPGGSVLLMPSLKSGSGWSREMTQLTSPIL